MRHYYPNFSDEETGTPRHQVTSVTLKRQGWDLKPTANSKFGVLVTTHGRHALAVPLLCLIVKAHRPPGFKVTVPGSSVVLLVVSEQRPAFF